MATKLLSLTCIRKERFSGRYPPVLRKHLNSRPRGGGGGDGSPSETAVLKIDEEEAVSDAVFRVTGMTCSACAGSIEKEIKRLPGIHEAVIDALNNRAQIQFYPTSVDVSFFLLFFLIENSISASSYCYIGIDRAVILIFHGIRVNSFFFIEC